MDFKFYINSSELTPKLSFMGQFIGSSPIAPVVGELHCFLSRNEVGQLVLEMRANDSARSDMRDRMFIANKVDGLTEEELELGMEFLLPIKQLLPILKTLDHETLTIRVWSKENEKETSYHISMTNYRKDINYQFDTFDPISFFKPMTAANERKATMDANDLVPVLNSAAKFIAPNSNDHREYIQIYSREGKGLCVHGAEGPFAWFALSVPAEGDNMDYIALSVESVAKIGKAFGGSGAIQIIQGGGMFSVTQGARKLTLVTANETSGPAIFPIIDQSCGAPTSKMEVNKHLLMGSLSRILSLDSSNDPVAVQTKNGHFEIHYHNTKGNKAVERVKMEKGSQGLNPVCFIPKRLATSVKEIPTTENLSIEWRDKVVYTSDGRQIEAGDLVIRSTEMDYDCFALVNPYTQDPMTIIKE